MYALWRVLYVYKDVLNEGQFNAWHARIVKEARKSNDSDLDLLARLMLQVYRNETNGFSLISEREWAVYLEAPNSAIRNMALLERERQAQFQRQWAEAIDLGERLVIGLDGEGEAANGLHAVARQVLAYNMLKVGDYDSYANHMYAVARLSENGFFLQKMALIYDLAVFAALDNDLELARKLQTLYSAEVDKHKLGALIEQDQQLCVSIAEKSEDYRGVINCLQDWRPPSAKLATPQDAIKLMALSAAYAHVNEVGKAEFYYAKLVEIPQTTFARGSLYDSYYESQLYAAKGDYRTAFQDMNSFNLSALRRAEKYRVASVQDMYKALRKELDSKTQESRLLVKQVQMRNLLLGAAGLIAVLLAVISVGGAFWVLRMRRLHRNLNEAHDHAEAANAAKSRFLAVMSHELRTPLNGMLGMAQTLKKGDLNGAQREQVDIMVDSGETLLALLNDVLDMSRIEAGKVELAPTPSTMKDMVDRVVNTYNPLLGSKDVVLSYHLDEGANRTLSFDVLRVYQCLSNLVSNAVKFTELGSVRINVSVTEEGDGYQVRCEVRDTGIGMSKAVIDKLFEAYSQADAMTVRKYGGSGLGLSISRRLAELMGGTLSVTSDETKGSTFVLTFHAGAVTEVAKAEPISASILAEDDDTLPGMSILLVDDHPINRKVARLFLEPFGFDITEAADGQEALDLDMSRFDLVLMDLNMPRMGGLEATRIYRANEAPGRRLPIVALTADAMKDQIAACHAAGMDAHIAKPIVMDTLIETVTRLLHLADEDEAQAEVESA
ncbi:hypothetical protein ABAC460_13395 [Asticcacaulis sp. AC460]|nr:hypothetical protein ABAC460_13395 [Asticcacaulis sp. AC460]